MPTQIFEMCGKGVRNTVMCHLVAIGAHDGRQGGRSHQFRKVTPNRSRQYLSWFDPASQGAVDGHPIVGQIFFPFGDASLDFTSDRVILDAAIAWCRFALGQITTAIDLQFIGHADVRGAAGFNTALGRQRAEAVRRYVDRGIKTNNIQRVTRYKSSAVSKGEAMATGDHAADRRVDIVLHSAAIEEFVEETEPLIVTGEYKGPLANKLLFRSWGGGGISIGVVAVEGTEIEVKNPRTGATAFYTYGGAGVSAGLPISFSPPSSDYIEWEVPFALVDVEDFEGPGAITTAGLGATGSCALFNGPKMHRTKKLLKNEKGVEVCSSGWALNAGISLTGGRWQRMPYRTEKEREAYLTQRQKDRHEGKIRQHP